MDIHKRLRRARQAAGMTQTAVAEATGIARPTLVAYETGRRVPSAEACALILRTLDVRPSDLLRTHRHELLELLGERGVTGPLVFGSVARGDDDPGSDLDLVLDFPSGTTLGGIEEVREALQELLGVEVDVVAAGGLDPDRPEHAVILGEAVAA